LAQIALKIDGSIWGANKARNFLQNQFHGGNEASFQPRRSGANVCAGEPNDGWPGYSHEAKLAWGYFPPELFPVTDGDADSEKGRYDFQISSGSIAIEAGASACENNTCTANECCPATCGNFPGICGLWAPLQSRRNSRCLGSACSPLLDKSICCNTASLAGAWHSQFFHHEAEKSVDEQVTIHCDDTMDFGGDDGIRHTRLVRDKLQLAHYCSDIKSPATRAEYFYYGETTSQWTCLWLDLLSGELQGRRYGNAGHVGDVVLSRTSQQVSCPDV